MSRAIHVSPATSGDLTWVADLEKKWFHQDAAPEYLLKEWYETNPNGFYVITAGENHHRIGHFQLLPIKPGVLERLCEGEITELDLHADSLYRPDEKEAITLVYLESLIVDLPDGVARAIVLRSLFKLIDQIMQAICNPAHLEYLYGMPVSPEGAKLISDFGLRIIKRAAERPDHHDFYSVPYSKLRKDVLKLPENKPES